MDCFESYEYVIKPKKDAKNKLLRLALLGLYAAYCVLQFVLIPMFP